jgi:dihydrofolate reductase
MRPVMWQMMISLDGRFEGEGGALDWHVVDDAFTAYVEAMLDATDTILFGRRTYEALAGYWPTATSPEASRMNALPKVVFSRSLPDAEWPNSRVVREDPVAEVRRLQRKDGTGSLSLFGSSALAATLLQAGAIDEVRVILCPVVLGRGRSLLEGIDDRHRLRLTATRELPSGVLILSYAPEYAGVRFFGDLEASERAGHN